MCVQVYLLFIVEIDTVNELTETKMTHFELLNATTFYEEKGLLFF